MACRLGRQPGGHDACPRPSTGRRHVISDAPAPGFSLVDQNGQPVTLTSLRGYTVALTFLDPVCTTDCPTIAQEFRVRPTSSWAQSAARVKFVAIAANPCTTLVSAVGAFDSQEGLTPSRTGCSSPGRCPAGAGVDALWRRGRGHAGRRRWWTTADTAYVIDAKGRTRAVLNADPGTGAADSLVVLDAPCRRAPERLGELKVAATSAPVSGQTHHLAAHVRVQGGGGGIRPHRGSPGWVGTLRIVGRGGPPTRAARLRLLDSLVVVVHRGHGPARSAQQHVLATLPPLVTIRALDAGHPARGRRQRRACGCLRLDACDHGRL